MAGKFTPAGRILTFDDSKVFGFGRKPQYYRWTTPLEYQLFRVNREAPQVDLKALKKTGSGAQIRIANSKSLNPVGKALAVEAWIKPERPAGVVVSRGGPLHGYALYLKNGQPYFAIRRDKQIYRAHAKQKIVGKWTHLAGVLTADKKLQVYVNGKLAGSGEAPGLLTKTPDQPTGIGADDRGAVSDYRSPFTFAGLIDEVRIYHGDLSAGEIAQHAAQPTNRDAKQAKLVLACSFDKGDAADESGCGNNGEIIGVNFAKGKVGQALKFKPTRRRGASHHLAYDWTQDVPLLVRGMTLAGDTLFIAGPPDMLDEVAALRRLGDAEVQAKIAEQDAALLGQRGGLLMAVSTADGATASRVKLASPPVWDGMAAANNRLYLATMDGKVVCLGGE